VVLYNNIDACYMCMKTEVSLNCLAMNKTVEECDVSGEGA